MTRYRFFTTGSESSVLSAIAATNHSSVPSRIRSSMIFPDDGEDDARESKDRPKHRIPPPHAHVPISKSSQPQWRGRRRDRWIGTTGGRMKSSEPRPDSATHPTPRAPGRGVRFFPTRLQSATRQASRRKPPPERRETAHKGQEGVLTNLGIGGHFPPYNELPCVLLPATAHSDTVNSFLRAADSKIGLTPAELFSEYYAKAYTAGGMGFGAYTGIATSHQIAAELSRVVRRMLGFI